MEVLGEIGINGDFAAIGVIGSIVVSVARVALPPLGNWFDRQDDRARQAAILWAFVTFVLGSCAYQLWDSGAVLTLTAMKNCVRDYMSMLVGGGSAYAMTKHVIGGSKRKSGGG